MPNLAHWVNIRPPKRGEYSHLCMLTYTIADRGATSRSMPTQLQGDMRNAHRHTCHNEAVAQADALCGRVIVPGNAAREPQLIPLCDDAVRRLSGVSHQHVQTLKPAQCGSSDRTPAAHACMDRHSRGTHHVIKPCIPTAAQAGGANARDRDVQQIHTATL